MTTIAYDGRYIATDGRASIGDIIVTDDMDKFTIVGENIFVMCGSIDDAKEFTADFSVGKKPKSESLNAGGFLFDGQYVHGVYVCDKNNVYKKAIVLCDMWADGSGRDWAVAAMDHGKSAIEAVRYAITRDTLSGGTIRCYDTKTKKFIKVKQ